MSDKAITLMDHEAIHNVVVDLFVETDNRNWKLVENCFAGEVLFDMRSAGGGEPTLLKPAQITAAWDEGLKAIEAIHHQVGNFRIKSSGNEATVFCYGIASHYIKDYPGGETRTFVGSYDFHLVNQAGDWKIDRFKFNLKYIDGNVELGTKS